MTVRRLRVNPAMLNAHGKHGAMSESVDGDFVRYEDARSLEDQLATLRSEVAYVRGRLESYARALEGWNVGAEVEIATALREDARRLGKLGGSVCSACNHVHLGTEKCGAPIHPPTTTCECVAKR